VAAVCVGGLVAHYEGVSAAVALMVAAAVTQLLLAARAVVLIESRRRHVLDVISEGRADLPIVAVGRVGVQLGSERHRRRLTQSVDSLLDAAVGSFDVVTTPWRFARADLVAGVRDELIQIRALLEGQAAGLAGMAMVERLLTDGTSSLHGDDPRVVREDLRRVRFLLAASRG
jgi:hypothetical protein